MANPSGGALTKLTITPLSGANHDKEEEGQTVTCHFNPKEFTIAKQNNWKGEAAKGQNVPHFEFGGGGATTLKLQLLFDTTEARPGSAAGAAVSEITKKLWVMMHVAEKKNKTQKGEPPYVRLKWGEKNAFDAIIESLSVKYTLFSPTGVPLRALVDISLKEAHDKKDNLPYQNPTSGGTGDIRLRTVRDGETLAYIAYEAYGDSGRWRQIAEANAIDDPLAIRPGMELLIKPLEP